MRYFITLLLFITTSITALYAEEAPILRLNTGTHTGIIKKIDTDRAGKLLLTCSTDKTAILWAGKTGRLIRVLRPPVGKGKEGRLYSCALSPNGEIAAVGGWTGCDRKKFGIYLFSTRSGEMLSNIGGMRDVILDMEFSPDGRWLACSLGGANGVQIIDIKSRKIHKRLTGYGKASYNISFALDGRLATVCYDGNIRLYSPDFELTRQKKATGGSQPYSIAFNPDGKRIAVGYFTTSTLQVLDGITLNLLYKPDITGTSKRNNLNKVCWSVNGKNLYAGGAFYVRLTDGTKWYMIRQWQEKGRGAYKDFPASRSSLTDIKIMPTESLFFGSTHSELGRINTKGYTHFYNKKAQLDLSIYNRGHLKVSPEEGSIGFTPAYGKPLTFTIKQQTLAEGEAPYPSARTSHKELSLTEWKNTYHPKLNGKPLDFLKEHEISRSLAISPYGTTIVLGTGWYIYGLDREGKMMWKQSVPMSAWAVNIAEESPIVVAAIGDGTLRWYNLADGTHLLTLFVHEDRKRWAIWTPEGYYDCSPGGKELIGWHVNRGFYLAADFFPVSRFAREYHRPDIIERVIPNASVKKAVLEAGELKKEETPKVKTHTH